MFIINNIPLNRKKIFIIIIRLNKKTKESIIKDIGRTFLIIKTLKIYVQIIYIILKTFSNLDNNLIIVKEWILLFAFLLIITDFNEIDIFYLMIAIFNETFMFIDFYNISFRSLFSRFLFCCF